MKWKYVDHEWNMKHLTKWTFVTWILMTTWIKAWMLTHGWNMRPWLGNAPVKLWRQCMKHEWNETWTKWTMKTWNQWVKCEWKNTLDQEYNTMSQGWSQFKITMLSNNQESQAKWEVNTSHPPISWPTINAPNTSNKGTWFTNIPYQNLGFWGIPSSKVNQHGTHAPTIPDWGFKHNIKLHALHLGSWAHN